MTFRPALTPTAYYFLQLFFLSQIFQQYRSFKTIVIFFCCRDKLFRNSEPNSIFLNARPIMRQFFLFLTENRVILFKKKIHLLVAFYFRAFLEKIKKFPICWGKKRRSARHWFTKKFTSNIKWWESRVHARAKWHGTPHINARVRVYMLAYNVDDT